MNRRLKVVLSYDGTGYSGFQRQGRGLPTIQDELTAAITTILGPPRRFAAAGRTDAGVHALGQVVAFDTSGTVPASRVVQALNANLPDAVSALEACEVSGDFHPRFDATGKTYVYSFYGWEGGPRQPLLARYGLHVNGRLNFKAMHEAAAAVVGRHEFSAFQDAGRPVKDATRTVQQCTLALGPYREPPLTGIVAAHLTVRADGFLYHMVRVISGTLLEVGRGRFAPEQVVEALAGGRRVLAGPTLPAHGLCLMEVHYGCDGDGSRGAAA